MKSSKGVSLAINTVVILILAVTVLIVLIGFLVTTSGPVQGEFEARIAQSQICGSYRNVDVKCDGSEYNEFSEDNEESLEKLGDACSQLGFQRCSGKASFECIQSCCIGCQSPEERTCSGTCIASTPNTPCRNTENAQCPSDRPICCLD